MTDADDASPSADHPPGEEDKSNVQSLTDLFDQMDRAAFKRALANRDAFRDAWQNRQSKTR